MNSYPEVSVILPIYNGSEYIEKCINSLICQTFSDFEIIVIDDGSTDESACICEKLQSTDSRIKLFKQNNKGVSAARNVGLTEAAGKYICFIDVDDEARKFYLEDLINDRGRFSGSGIVIQDFTGYVGERKLMPYIGAGQSALKHIVESKVLLYSEPYAKLFDNDIIKRHNIKFPLDVHMGEDGIFVCQYLYFVENVSISIKNNYLRNITPDSLSGRLNSFSSEFKGYILWKEKLSLLLRKYDDSEINVQQVQWDVAGNLFLRATRSLKNIETINGRVNLLKSLDKNEWDIFRCYKTKNVKAWVKKKLLENKFFFIYALLLSVE
ncbi:TPA: glycosyltransferase family 2 protein [Serratia fonticola]|nr:glycosyltransferase family 2 protein [Serratia fonticola]